MPRWRPGARGTLAALLLGWTALAWLNTPPLAPINRALYDLRLRLLAPRQADDRVAIVDIDERALAAHGRWPWPRDQLALLLQRSVLQEGAAVVGLDMVLAEPDRAVGLHQAPGATAQRPARGGRSGAAAAPPVRHQPEPQWPQPAQPPIDNDGLLALALRGLPVVLGFHLSNERGAARIGSLPPPLLPLPLLGAGGAALPAWAGHGGNLPALQAAARLGGGCLNALIDADGVVRRLPLLVQHQGGVQPTLALAMARALLAADGGPPPPRDTATVAATTSAPPTAAAAPSTAAVAAPGAAVRLLLHPDTPPLQSVGLVGPGGRVKAPVDAQAVALVPYAAPGAGVARYSAADLLAGRLPADALRGKLVLVGVSAPGLIDQRHTPVDAAMLGTEVHAHMLSGLLQGRVMAAPAAAPVIEAAALLGVGGLLVWALPRRPVWQALLITLVAVAGWMAADAWAWQRAGWALPLAAGLLLPPLLLAASLVLAYRRAHGARRQLAQLFGQYVPPELVAEMSLAPQRHNMRSRSAELTVLFADVSGFTTLAERLPPAALGAMMNLVFSHLTDVVHAHRGTLDKYIGDAVMVFWGAPLDDADHAAHAVAAALAMQARLPAIHADLAAQGWPALALNIGINTGTMVVGDMGSRHRRAYTVMGDAVNAASRLQALCSQHQLGLLVGDATRAALGDRLCLGLGTLPLRGRDALEPVWQPLPWRAGEHPPADRWTLDWQRLRLAVDAGQRADALALLDRLATDGAPAPLCRWQRAALLVSAAPAAPNAPTTLSVAPAEPATPAEPTTPAPAG